MVAHVGDFASMCFRTLFLLGFIYCKAQKYGFTIRETKAKFVNFFVADFVGRDMVVKNCICL